VLATVRHAVKAMCALKFAYDGGSTPGRLHSTNPRNAQRDSIAERKL